MNTDEKPSKWSFEDVRQWNAALYGSTPRTQLSKKCTDQQACLSVDDAAALAQEGLQISFRDEDGHRRQFRIEAHGKQDTVTVSETGGLIGRRVTRAELIAAGEQIAAGHRCDGKWTEAEMAYMRIARALVVLVAQQAWRF